MSGRIDYQIEKYSFIELAEFARLSRQWARVIERYRQSQAGAEDARETRVPRERLRMALESGLQVTALDASI